MDDAVFPVDEVDLAGLACAAGLQDVKRDVIQTAFVAVQLQLQLVAPKDIAHLIQPHMALGRQGVAALIVANDIALEHATGLTHLGLTGGGDVSINFAIELVPRDKRRSLRGRCGQLFGQPGAGGQRQRGAGLGG